MQVCRNIMVLTVIISLSLGLAGCGGGVPSTGEQVVSEPDEDTKKKMVEGYLKKMTKPKGQNKAKPR